PGARHPSRAAGAQSLISARPYKPSDFEAALDVINSAAAADQTRRMVDDLFRVALSGPMGNQAAVAGRDHLVSAFVWSDVQQGSTLRLEGWVHPNCRRKGIGTALLTAVESRVRRRESLPVTRTAG